MAINGKSLATIQNNVTGLTTNETDFRSGMDDIINQVDDNANLAVLTGAADLTKLSQITATSTELNTLDGITSSVQELNILDGVTATAQELNLLDGVTATTAEINLLDGITATKAEINKLDGFTGNYLDLNKIADVSATATELNVLDGFLGNTADLNRTVKLDAAGDGLNGQVLSWNSSGQTYKWETPSSFTWILEDGDGTEVNIATQEVKFVEGSGIDINWTDISTGSDADPFDLTITNTDKGSSQNIFKNIAVSGQSTIVADSNNDTLNIVGGTGISVGTDANSDTVTIGITSSSITSTQLADNSVTASEIAANAVGASEIASSAVGASELNVVGNGTTSQFLRADGDGSFTWATPPNSTYTAGTNLSLVGSQFKTVDTPTFTSINTGDITVTGTLTETSDARLKENIRPLENALDNALLLNGVSFNKIATPELKEIGFIAQEVQDVLPSLTTVSDDGTLSVSYSRTVALLVEAIKELKLEIEELKK